MRRIGLWVALAALLVICDRWLTSCVGTGPCMSTLAGARDWLGVTLAATILLAIVTSAAWVVRTVWLVAVSSLELHRVPTSPAPAHLGELASSVGIRRIRFLPSSGHAVFCAGAMRPAVYVSQGVCDRLDSQELAAVLVHELEHASSFDPIRRAAWRAASDVFFFLPVFSWLRTRRIEASELRADRRAIDQLGPKPVASALWSLGSAGLAIAVAAFSGTVEVRTAQLLGDPLPRRLPSALLIALSLGGLAFALAVMACVTQIAGHIH